MVFHRTARIQIHPDKKQKHRIGLTPGCCRHVHNQMPEQNGRIRRHPEIIISVLIIACLFWTAYKKHSYDWDAAVQKHVSVFSCRPVCLGSHKDPSSGSIIYGFQTDDDRQIRFDVRCFWGYPILPIGFKSPVKLPITIDNFAEQVCAYVSETEGEYCMEGKSVEEISAYVLDTIHGCEALFQEYGIKNKTPSISFTFRDTDKTYAFRYGNTNEVLLADRLTELLYK